MAIRSYFRARYLVGAILFVQATLILYSALREIFIFHYTQGGAPYLSLEGMVVLLSFLTARRFTWWEQYKLPPEWAFMSRGFLSFICVILCIWALYLETNQSNSGKYTFIGMAAAFAGGAIVTQAVRGSALFACVTAAVLLAHIDYSYRFHYFPIWFNLDWITPREWLNIALFGIAAIYLLSPRRVRRVDGPIIEYPDDSNWRQWLLHSLRKDGIRVLDRFAFSILTILALPATFLAGLLLMGILRAPSAGLLSLLFLPAMLVFGLLVSEILRLHRRFIASNAIDEIESDSSRRPIFYLRAFYRDKFREEALVMDVFRKYGPVIAIGRPKERVPTIGAARFYVLEGVWKETVAALVKVSQLVVWTTGMTEGLRWELVHLIENISPEKLIIWVHAQIRTLEGETAQARQDRIQREWQQFIRSFGSIFPVPLPHSVGDAAFIYFDSNFAPTLVAPTRRNLVSQASALQEVLRRKGFSLSERSRNQKFLILFVTALVVLVVITAAVVAVADLLRGW